MNPYLQPRYFGCASMLPENRFPITCRVVALWFQCRLLLFAVFILSVTCVSAMTPQDLLAAITPQAYENAHTNLFVGNGMNRGFTGDLDGNIHRVPAYQHDLARDFIFDRFESFGLDTWLDPFWFTRSYGAVTYTYTNCHNVVAYQPGIATNARWFIVGAHYDSVDPGQFSQLSPGADDNATGVAATLELARSLSAHTFRDHIVYIAFDAEEKGLKGAWHFVDTHTTDDPSETNLIQRADVGGVISLDMLGYNPVGAHHNKVRIYGGSASSNAPVQTALRNAFYEYTDMDVVHSGFIAASDHHPFHARDMDACLLIEYNVWSNPHYHEETDSIDTPDYIDYVYATELTRAVAAYLMREAGILLPASLSFTSPEAENQIRLQWTAQSNSIYRIQYTEQLSTNTQWHTLSVMTNTAGTVHMHLDDEIESVPQRYYRVEHLYEP